MAKSILSAPHLHNEEAAFTYVETQLWPNGPVCPHCGNVDAARIGRLQGKSSRPGLRKCYACRKTFTVRVGSIFEDSHFPLHLWLQAIQFVTASKKGISTRQIQRAFDCSMKTAWFLMHRIREAMKDSAGFGALGGGGAIVEADETFITRSPKTRRPKDAPPRETRQVLSLVERGGAIRSQFLDHRTVRQALWGHLDKDAQLRTDSAMSYRKIMPHGQHEFVDHSKGEYVRGDAHTNTLEGFFSVFKRGLIGVYQHMDKKHLDRYLAEFDFRFNTREKLGINDAERAARAVMGAKGKRLPYRTTRRQEALDTPPF